MKTLTVRLVGQFEAETEEELNTIKENLTDRLNESVKDTLKNYQIVMKKGRSTLGTTYAKVNRGVVV